MQLVVIVIPTDQVHFAESCTGTCDISQAVSSGLELLAERLQMIQGSNPAAQNEDGRESLRKH